MKTLNRILNSLNLEKICALYVILWIFIPPVQVGTLYRVLAVGCSVLWVLLVISNNPKAISLLSKYVLIAVLCVGLMILWGMSTYGIVDGVVNHIQIIIIFICGAIATYYMKTDKDFFELLIGACLLFISVFCLTTIVGVIENPYASRIANSEWLEERFEEHKNVGLYGYVYMCVLIAPMLLYKMVKKVKVNNFIDFFTIVAFILITIMGILAGYMIANLCLILGYGLVLLLHKPTIARITIFAIIIIIFILFYKDLVTGFFDLLESLLGSNPAYGQKIEEFRKLFLDGDAGGVTVDERFSNYQASLRLIYRYPIIGSFIFGVSGAGGHSAILDTIGRYGWLTTCLYFYLMWKYPFEIYKNKKPQMVKLLIIVFIIFSVFNPYTQELSIALFLFFPYIIRISDEHDCKLLSPKHLER